MDSDQLKKRMVIMLICVGILFGGIFIYKIIGSLIFKHIMSSQVPVVTVSTMKVEYTLWRPQLKGTASLRAIRGVNVTSEVAGMVQKIYFAPGSVVKQNAVLMQLNADNDIALLQSLEANAELARINAQRDKALFAARAVSKATLDTDVANFKSFSAQVAQQAAIVAKKTIRAPFTGRLGISAVNPGQFINPGDKVVTLQELDPIYADFYVPQQDLVRIRTGQDVALHVDVFPNKVFFGKISTIDPLIDATTRNVEVEATIANSNSLLTPGMFASLIVTIGQPQKYLTLPQTSIAYNPYGDNVFVVQQTGKDKNGKPILTVSQKFVTTGETRGDQVAILDGIKAGDVVVTAGQIKLKSGSLVAINNSVEPANNPAPSSAVNN